jgi:hypothetical protein
MAETGFVALLERYEPWSLFVGALLPGLALGALLQPYYQPFGMAAGLFGGSAVAFFALASLVRQERPPVEDLGPDP